MDDFVFTSESVTEGHPDKLCDQISDSILDSYLLADPFSRLDAECAVAKGILFIAVRFASNATIDVPMIARQAIRRVGYGNGNGNGNDGGGFTAENCNIMTSLSEVADARQAIDEAELDDAGIEAIFAGNQVTQFGYACTQTAALMPSPIWLAHKLARRIATVRLTRQLGYLAPDGKTQVAVEYRNRRPYRIHSVAVTAAIDPGGAPSRAVLEANLIDLVVKPAFEDELIRPDNGTRIFINPGGPFFTGGPEMHAGLTGRKNAIDTYGEYSRHSGAALSGKDPTRIDRVGAYAARYAAKNVVAAGLAEECELQLSYSIGMAQPVSLRVQTFGTGRISDEEIARRLRAAFEFRPAGIIAEFNLRRLPALFRGRFYSRLAAYGHVGRMDIGLPWERVDKTPRLRD
jgi:S-adenosylmethionine synthetase